MTILFESMAVGLHLQGARARLVCAFPQEGGGIAVHDWACLSSRARFQRYWAQLMHPHWRPCVIVAGDPDPLGIVPWLQQHRVYPSWTPVFEPDLFEDLAWLGLPRTHARAYDLCLTACCRLKDHTVQVELWRECHRLQERLARVTTDLGRLIGHRDWSPEPEFKPPPDDAPIPF